MSGILVNRQKSLIFFFTDDTLFFCQLEVATLLNLKSILLYFQAIPRLKINTEKSELAEIAANRPEFSFADVLNYKKSQLPISYLGNALALSIKTALVGNR